ncbi:MAG: AmmeMemoRadiSam system protein A [Candidatus Binatia bacterium]
MEAIDIPPDSQKRLLDLSRRTLNNFVGGLGRENPDITDTYLMTPEYGAFVSLHKERELRGCIGICFPTRPLYETTIEMTEAAASQDNRVSQVRESELRQIHIEISILSPLHLAPDPLSLTVGTHGLYVASGRKRGVLLPQVATEHGWDLKTFLCQVCRKADLPQDAWKWQETRILGFTTLIIREES